MRFLHSAFGLGILVWIAGIQPPTELGPTDPYASNTVSSDQIRFNGLRAMSDQASVRATFGEPDRVYTYHNEDLGDEIIWVYGRSEVSFHQDDHGFGTFLIKDARYPVKIGTLTLRVGESAAPLATAFPISWRNRDSHRDTGNLWLRLSLTDGDVERIFIEIDGDGKIVSIGSYLIRV